MTFSAVGATISPVFSGGGTNSTTFSLTPNTIGDFILLEVSDFGVTALPTSASSSNVTWSLLGASYLVTNTALGQPTPFQVFIGTVTSTSTATVTISWSGSSATPLATGQEFSSTKGAASVTLDVQGDFSNNAGGTTWSSLTPTHGSGELYFGYAQNANSAVAGSTSGYVYNASGDGHGDGSAYNLNCPNSATAPVWGDSGQCAGVMVLVYEAGGGPAAGPAIHLPNQALRARLHSQGQQLYQPGLTYANSVRQVP